MGLGYGIGAGYGLSNSNGENQCQPLKQTKPLGLTSKTQRVRCGAQGARVELIPAQDHLLLVALSA